MVNPRNQSKGKTQNRATMKAKLTITFKVLGIKIKIEFGN